jgi:hypothetical protein
MKLVATKRRKLIVLSLVLFIVLPVGAYAVSRLLHPEYASFHRYCRLCLLGCHRDVRGGKTTDSAYGNRALSKKIMSLYPAHTEHRWIQGPGESGSWEGLFTWTEWSWSADRSLHYRRMARHHRLYSNESLAQYIADMDAINQEYDERYRKWKANCPPLGDSDDGIPQSVKKHALILWSEMGDAGRHARLGAWFRLVDANPGVNMKESQELRDEYNEKETAYRWEVTDPHGKECLSCRSIAAVRINPKTGERVQGQGKILHDIDRNGMPTQIRGYEFSVDGITFRLLGDEMKKVELD